MNSILFLDIDGVLNSLPYIREIASSEEGVEGARDINPEQVQLLNEILRRTGAQVVVSSSWRDPNDPTFVATALESRGFEGTIVGQTPHLYRWGEYTHRGDEIQAWLDSQPDKPDKFVIVDDDSDMLHLEPYLVKTDAMKGLTRDDVETIVSRLGEL